MIKIRIGIWDMFALEFDAGAEMFFQPDIKVRCFQSGINVRCFKLIEMWFIDGRGLVNRFADDRMANSVKLKRNYLI